MTKDEGIVVAKLRRAEIAGNQVTLTCSENTTLLNLIYRKEEK